MGLSHSGRSEACERAAPLRSVLGCWWQLEPSAGSLNLWCALLVGDEDASLGIIGGWDVTESDMYVFTAGFSIFDEGRCDAFRKRAFLLWGPTGHPCDLNVGHAFLPRSD